MLSKIVDSPTIYNLAVLTGTERRYGDTASCKSFLTESDWVCRKWYGAWSIDSKAEVSRPSTGNMTAVRRKLFFSFVIGG